MGIVGHSFGASVALMLPSEIKKKDQSNLSHECIYGIVPIGQVGLEVAKKAVALMRIFYLPSWLLWFIRPILGQGFRERAFHSSVSDALFYQEATASQFNPVYMFKAYYTQLANWKLTCNIIVPDKLPILMLNGEADKIAPASGIGDIVSMLGIDRVESHEIKLSGHQCMQERPEEVNSLIEGFLTRVYHN